MKSAKRNVIVGASIITCLLSSLVGTYFYLHRFIGFQIKPGFERDVSGLVHLVVPSGFSKSGGNLSLYTDIERNLEVIENSDYYRLRIGRFTGWLEVTSEETNPPFHFSPMSEVSSNKHQNGSATEVASDVFSNTVSLTQPN